MDVPDDDNVCIVYTNICLRKFAMDLDTKYKQQKLKDVTAAVCALLNSNGGKIELRFDDTEVKASLKSKCIRLMENKFITFAGTYLTLMNIDFLEHKTMIVVNVKKSDLFITINYYLFLPTETQVVSISGVEAKETIKDVILNRVRVSEPTVKLGSHEKRFHIRIESGIPESKSVMFKQLSPERTPNSLAESKMVQFKGLKSDAPERTTLADHIASKGNKFRSYVSAFANLKGGHIYYGINDDGVVQGELVPSEEEKKEITKKVEKAINKMIWPELIGQPKRGEHWEIFFELVIDETFKPIPSTFVIVIYIASCLGGVFTEVPECYEIVERKVEKISFATWKKRMLQPYGFDTKDEIPATIQRIRWSSPKTERLCTEAEEILMAAINNGEWETFSAAAKTFEERCPEVEIQLVVLSKRVMANYRKGSLTTARRLLLDYSERLSKTKELLIFEVIHLYLKAALERVTRNFEGVRKILAGALSMTELIPPGIVTAATFSFAALMNENSGNGVGSSSDMLSTKVLEHLMHVKRPSKIKADLEHKAHITLATFKLGYIMSGKIIKKDVNKLELEKAESSVTALNESENLLSQYRKIQFTLTKSILHYRYSQIEHERKEMLLKASQYSKKAEDLARDLNFNEMINWARATAALCGEELSTPTV